MLNQKALNQKRHSRIDYIDVFRGFGIIAMVMGHIGFGEAFDYFIHAFHMPMFFWISGYLFKHKTKEELPFYALLLKKAKTLLVPYFVFGIWHYLFSVGLALITHGDIELSPLLHLFWINTDGLAISGALWFLTALFFTDLLFFLLDRYISSNILKTILIVLIAITGNLLPALFSFTLPFAIGPSLVGLGFYYIGYLSQKHEKQKLVHFLLNLSWLPTIAFGVVTTILIFLNGYINMRTEIYSIIPLFWLNGTLAIFVGLNLSRLIYKYIQNCFLGKWLLSIGRNSIVYVCLNQVVIFVLNYISAKIGNIPYLSAFLILLLSLTALWIISKIIMNTKLRLIVGRK